MLMKEIQAKGKIDKKDKFNIQSKESLITKI